MESIAFVLKSILRGLTIFTFWRFHYTLPQGKWTALGLGERASATCTVWDRVSSTSSKPPFNPSLQSLEKDILSFLVLTGELWWLSCVLCFQTGQSLCMLHSGHRETDLGSHNLKFCAGNGGVNGHLFLCSWERAVGWAVGQSWGWQLFQLLHWDLSVLADMSWTSSCLKNAHKLVVSTL